MHKNRTIAVSIPPNKRYGQQVSTSLLNAA